MKFQFVKFLPVLTVILTHLSACHKDVSQAVQPRLGQPLSAQLSSNDRSIPNELLCFNVNSVRVDSWREPRFIQSVKGLAPSVLRIPGGQVANYWDWRRGGVIQNLENLPDGLPFFLRNKRDRAYQSSKLTDIQAGLEATATTPLFVLNMMSSSLDQQLEMLQTAEQLGMPVQEVELGNEFYFSMKNNRAVFPSSQDYAQTARIWTDQIQKRYPRARVSVVGDVKNDPFPSPPKPRRDYWNRAIFSKKPVNFDAISLHVYSENGLNNKSQIRHPEYPFFSERDLPFILGEPFRHWHNLRQEHEFQIIPDQQPIWITEYNLHEKGDKSRGGHPRVAGSWAHGLYTLAMSLLFLEDSRVEKICNHMLVGNSQFSAIYADDKSFRNPTDDSVQSVPFSLSATGTAFQYFAQALDGADRAQQIEFSNGPILTGKENFEYPAVYGWHFSGKDGENSAIILNLANSAIQVRQNRIFLGETSIRQISGSPRTLVTGPGRMNEIKGQASDTLSLPAYSITVLED